MAAVPYAHIVAHLMQSKHPKGTDITLAPNPRDIVSTPLLDVSLLPY
jgi:calcium permeable stress-gated cation channel